MSDRIVRLYSTLQSDTPIAHLRSILYNFHITEYPHALTTSAAMIIIRNRNHDECSISFNKWMEQVCPGKIAAYQYRAQTRQNHASIYTAKPQRSRYKLSACSLLITTCRVHVQNSIMWQAKESISNDSISQLSNESGKHTKATEICPNFKPPLCRG